MLDKVAGSKILHARQQKLSDLNTARQCWDIREPFILFITLLPLCMVEQTLYFKVNKHFLIQLVKVLITLIECSAQL